MAPDRMPHEVRSDLELLFVGTEGRPSAQEKHLKRVEWVRTNLDSVLKSFALGQGDWDVHPLFVASHPLHASLLGHAKVKVLSVSELSDGSPLTGT